MLKPIHFETDNFVIHPFGAEEFERLDQLAEEIFAILSDEKTLTFIPSKRLNNLEETKAFLRISLVNFHTGRNFLHFITSKQEHKVVGIIDLISPAVAKEHYKIDRYPYFIEFYLSSFASGCYIMTQLLPVVVESILDQGIPTLAAVVNRQNTAAKKVLQKAKFKLKNRFDIVQDYYETHTHN
ncbi:GNAT family N-acetyltransferase [Pedobacter duraquae]|uniref:Acetyltransferase (GNAT) family protein n=1 Tax=Pedobacter duraquae TaxID=425511 RepID=A0A4R6IQB8_9SPHI|nr:GNAT family N-acetyltransferase [Pedobacter duraquae]TDO24483.1 acetyltransferase (GNAT) family protein [Pedobacter duraquae]